MSPAEPLRILLVSANYRPSVGGIERFVEILAEELAARGHVVTVACCATDGGGLHERRRGVEVVRLPGSNLPRALLGVPYPLPSPRSLRRSLRPLVAAADVVNVHDALYATSLAALGHAGRHGTPSVLTQHVGFVPQGNRLLDLAQGVAIRSVGRAARSASVVTAYNESVADWATATWGIAPPRLLPSGVRVPAVSTEQRAQVRHELGVPDGSLLALFAGRDVAKKHLDVFLAAADPGAYHLVAVTDRRDSGRQGARLVPFVPPERFGVLLASSDAFVLPSEAEGFPLALQEALVAGLPCVIVPHAGYERYLAPGDVVTIARDPDALRSALRELARSPARREELAARARVAGARSFGVPAFVDAYEALYRELARRTS